MNNNIIEINKVDTHPQYFEITDFDRFFKQTNRFLSSNIHFIDLSISFRWSICNTLLKSGSGILQNAEHRTPNADFRTPNDSQKFRD